MIYHRNKDILITGHKTKQKKCTNIYGMNLQKKDRSHQNAKNKFVNTKSTNIPSGVNFVLNEMIITIKIIKSTQNFRYQLPIQPMFQHQFYQNHPTSNHY